jgi:hypothetical protein
MASLAPIDIAAADKLRLLRRLDRFRKWESLDDKRQCIQCGEIISGHDIEVVGGTRELGPLRLQCPTENCRAMPMDWILLNDSILAAKNGQPATKSKESKRSSRGNFAAGWFRRLLRHRN